jgi:hypothetical protein
MNRSNIVFLCTLKQNLVADQAVKQNPEVVDPEVDLDNHRLVITFDRNIKCIFANFIFAGDKNRITLLQEIGPEELEIQGQTLTQYADQVVSQFIAGVFHDLLQFWGR